MEPIVVDSNIIVASFLEKDAFHQRSQQYINGLRGLRSGDYVFHLPMLVIVEVISAISRQAQRGRLALLARARQSLTEWESSRKIVLYPLDRNRMDNATNTAERHRLRGSDAVIVALAEELDMPLHTFDSELQQRFTRAQA